MAVGCLITGRCLRVLLLVDFVCKATALMAFQEGRTGLVPGVQQGARTTCFRNSTATCGLPGMFHCDHWHAGAICGDKARCHCPDDKCMDASGKCVPKEVMTHEAQASAAPTSSNKGHFTVQFRNARFPERYLAMGDLPGKDPLFPAPQSDFRTKFTLLPDPEDGVLYLKSEGEGRWRGTLCSSPHAFYAVKEPQPLACTVTLIAAPSYEGMPKGEQSFILEVGMDKFWSRVRHSAVEDKIEHTGSFKDPGRGTEDFWIATPSLPYILAPYTGPGCVSDCGAYGSGKSTGVKHFRSTAGFWFNLAFILLCLFCVCCVN